MQFLYFVLMFVVASKTDGVQLFDPTAEMCCRGKVHPIQDGGGRSYCCGDDLYDASLSICCQSKVLRKPEGNASFTVSCCGQDLYDFRTAICCQESVIEFPVNPDQNVTAISAEIPIDEPVTGGFSTEVERRANAAEHLTMACCGREGYDWRLDMCGEQGVKPRPFPQAEACGLTEEVYDVRKQICCGDTVVGAGNGVHAVFCCANEGYDRYSSLCCKGRVKAKPDPEREYRCCGHDLYDPDQELCCDSEKLVLRKPDDNLNSTAECCGQAMIVNNHQQTQLCCDGVVHTVDTPENNLERSGTDSGISPRESFVQAPLECCGERVFSRTAEVCCGHGVVHSLALMPRSTTRNNTVAVEPGVVIGCCGDELMLNPNLDMCCDGQIVTRRTSATRCCGTGTFESNQNTQNMCCNGKVLTKVAASEQCCGDALFNTATHSCCFESSSFQVLEKAGTSTACCTSGV